MSIQPKFQLALQLHQRGELARAQNIYEEILRGHPQHVESLQMLAFIAGQSKNPHRALMLMDKALTIDSNNAVLLFNRGVTLQELSQWEAALTSYSRAIALKPDLAEAYSNRSVVQCELHRFAEAILSCDQAIAIRESFPAAWFNRGNAQVGLKQSEAALESYNRAITLKRDYAEAWFNRGNSLRRLDNSPGAAIPDKSSGSVAGKGTGAASKVPV